MSAGLAGIPDEGTPLFVTLRASSRAGRTALPSQLAAARGRRRARRGTSRRERFMAEFLSTLTGVQHANPDGSERQTLIAQCQLGERLVLVLEAEDPPGEHAVAVCRAGGGRLGYLPDADAQ